MKRIVLDEIKLRKGLEEWKLKYDKLQAENAELKARWEKLKEFIQPVGWRTPYMDNMTLVEVLKKMHQLESGEAGKVK